MNKLFINIFLFLLGCALGVNAKDKPIEIKLSHEILGKTPTVEVIVNGKVRTFYFDTGGGVSFFSPEIAKEMNCSPISGAAGYNAGGMKFTLKRCEDIDLKISDLSIKRDVYVADPTPFFPNAKAKIDGSIALDVFDNRILTIDMAGNRLWVETEKSFKQKTKNMKELTSRLSREVAGSALDIFIAAKTPKGKIWMLFDTGNTNKLLFTPSAQNQLGIDFNGENNEKIIKPVSLDIIGIGEFKADGREREMIYDGMLNYEVIEKMTFTVDFRNGKMWAKLN